MEQSTELTLVCPSDGTPLETTGEELRCPRCDTRLPVDDGIACFPCEPASRSETAEAGKPVDAGEPSEAGKLQTERETRARDEQAPLYDRLRGLRLLSLWELPAATRALAPREGEVVLDAGCGTGRLLSVLNCTPGVKLAGADISLDSLKLCKEKLREAGAHPTLVRASLWKLPFEDGAFHAVGCLQVIEHVPGAELRAKVYAELRRVMKPGGRLFLTAYHFWPRPVGGLLMKREGYHKGGIYFFRFRPNELRRELEAYFEVREIQPICGYVLAATCVKRGGP